MQVSIDKVRLWIEWTIAGEQYPAIVNHLDGVRQVTDLITGEVKTFGNLEGMKVSIYAGGLSVVGSLCKYLNGGSNVFPLDRHTTAQAIEKLSEALHMQVGGAVVTEMEFGTNFMMKHPVADYISRLGTIPRSERVQVTPASIRYEGTGKRHPKVFAFYDKLADADSKGMDYPEDLKDKNLLRYEIRYNGRLPHQLGVPEVTASTLSNDDFYRRMIKRYQDIYFSISKFNQIKTDVMSEIKTPKDAFNLFVARLINQTDQSEIGIFLDELKRAGVFEDRKNYSRLKKKIQEVSTKANITITDDLIKELDDEIKNCGAYP